MSMRMEKIDRLLQKQLMEIIQKEVDDPIFEFFSITRVKTTRDLQESKVYFSLLADDKYKEALKTLKKMKPFLRAMLGERIHLKVLPVLNFFPDESIKYSVDIYQKIEEINAEHADQDHQEDNR
jgi:ribosome-binding factor A